MRNQGVMNAFESALPYLTEKAGKSSRARLLEAVLIAYNVDLRREELENRIKYNDSNRENPSQIVHKETFDYGHMITDMEDAVKSVNRDKLINFICSHYRHDIKRWNHFMSVLARNFASFDQLTAGEGLATSCQMKLSEMGETKLPAGVPQDREFVYFQAKAPNMPAESIIQPANHSLYARQATDLATYKDKLSSSGQRFHNT